MQGVILAAGRGTRMRELTEPRPKGLLEVAGRPLLEYTFDALPDSVDEVIIVVGYLGGMIHDCFGGEHSGRRILYAEQEPRHGTAGALWSAKDALDDSFIVMNGDDIYARDDVARIAGAKDWAMLVAETKSLKEGGKIKIDKRGCITDVVEGKHDDGPGLMSAGVYKLDTRIFSHPLVPKAPGSPEFGLPQTALASADHLKIPLEAITAKSWIQITSPEDLQKAEEILAENH
ncbi:MAG TPA: sugar phosphate nucleotidyltransferase [Candidatus Paceibacterota bacterium]